ncbi:MAG: BamA/TamA family outer membrane protein [Thiohalomonadaceae bacterium]
MGRARSLVLVLLLVAQAAAARAAEGEVYLGAIRFEGNERTREQIMLQEMRVRPGRWVSHAAIEASRQAVMDLGLFQRVTARLEEGEEGQVLVMTVKEKFYLLPMPILDGDPQTQDVNYGFELRADNLLGLNQRLRVIAEHEDSTSEVTPKSDSYRIAYHYPRLLGTAYTFDLDTRLTSENFNAEDEDGSIVGKYDRDVVNVSIHASRWLAPEGPSAGWRGGMGINYAVHAYEYISGEPDFFEDGRAISLTASLGFSEVHDHGYYLSGAAYGWDGNIGLPALGSDFAFNRHLFHLRLYHHLPEQNANVNWRLRIGFGDGEVFGGKAFSIGGFTTLRGYERSIRGNAMALSNLEYHQQLDDWPSVRGVLFLDLGNVYDEVIDMEPGDLEAGIGFGVRWRVQFLVDVTVSADVGFGLGPGETVAYLGTSGTF